MHTLTIDGNKHKVNSEVSNLVLLISKERDELKELVEENRVSLLQYESLRKNFGVMVDSVLGESYYNMAMDVYDSDWACCEDITRKANRTALERLFDK